MTIERLTLVLVVAAAVVQARFRIEAGEGQKSECASGEARGGGGLER